MKKITRFVAVTMLITAIGGNTVFAAETKTNEVIAAEEVTAESMEALQEEVNAAAAEEVDANTALVAATAAEMLSGGTYTYTDASQISRLVQLGYACNQEKHQGPFFITKGVLNYNNWFHTKKDVYVVALSGTDTTMENQTTGVWTDLLVGFEFDNRYIQNVKQAILETVPAGSNILVTGHSLGGMVAQQVASDSDLKKKYNILNTVTFGSPVINGFEREGTVKRLGDKSDVVPFLSLTTFTNVVWQSAGLNREDGGYGLNLMGAHCESYNRSDVWGGYDVTGTKGGSKTLTIDYSTTTFFYSPVTVTE